MPNPTTPAVDVAEGRRLLEALREAQAITHTGGSSSFEALAQANADRWFAIHGPALLRAASERDAAVREAEAMKRLLAELADNLETTTQDSFLRGGGWQGSEDCLGIERARAALASAAPGGANG